MFTFLPSHALPGKQGAVLVVGGDTKKRGKSIWSEAETKNKGWLPSPSHQEGEKKKICFQFFFSGPLALNRHHEFHEINFKFQSTRNILWSGG